MPAKIDREARKYEIAVKAMKLFSQVGYDNVTLIMIASAAGVARTVLYRYFRSKREVFNAAIRTSTRAIMSQARKEMALGGKVSDRLSRVCFVVTDLLFEKREFLSAIFDFVLSMVRQGEDMSGRIIELTGGIKEIFKSILSDGVMKGEFNSDVNPEHTSEMFFSLLESCVLRIVLGTDKTSANIRRQFADLILALNVNRLNNLH
jgi:AcrR family transcriptional regulator